VKEDVQVDLKENSVQYHLKDDNGEVTVINDFNRVSRFPNSIFNTTITQFHIRRHCCHRVILYTLQTYQRLLLHLMSKGRSPSPKAKEAKRPRFPTHLYSFHFPLLDTAFPSLIPLFAYSPLRSLRSRTPQIQLWG